MSECVVPWPLHLKGRGRRPEDTVLVACRGCSALLFMSAPPLTALPPSLCKLRILFLLYKMQLGYTSA